MRKSSRIPQKRSKVLNTNLSFAGCGFLGIYHVGVGVCFKKYAKHLLLHKIAGASAGALVASCLLLDTPLDEMAAEFFDIVRNARSHKLGPFSPIFNIQTVLMDKVKRYVPADAHLKVNGRLHLSLTRIYDGKNIIVSQFNSREDLIEALACSFFIPGFSGLVPPKFHNVRYMDGAFSDNLVKLDENTVTVSPFSGESDICPQDESLLKYYINVSNTSVKISTRNVSRLIRSLMPPPLSDLSQMCQQGYNDALKFLYKNDLISCEDCSTIQLNYLTSHETTEKLEPECTCCEESREQSIKESMPDYILNVLASHVEGSNGLLTKFVQVLTLPVTIPCEIAAHIFNSIPTAEVSENVHEAILKAISQLAKTEKTEEEIAKEKFDKLVEKFERKIKSQSGGSKR